MDLDSIGDMYRNNKTGVVYELILIDRLSDTYTLRSDATSHTWVIGGHLLSTYWTPMRGSIAIPIPSGWTIVADPITQQVKGWSKAAYSDNSQISWGEHCWHTWKEYPLFTSVEIRCSKCGKLKEDDLEAEDAHKG